MDILIGFWVIVLISVIVWVIVNYRGTISRKVNKITIDPVLKEKRFSKLKEQYQKFEEIFSKKASEKNDSNRNSVRESNSVCPKCNSTNVNNRIKRIQGSLDGEVSGSSFLLAGSLYGSVHGSLDTNEVNKCNSCQHEWKVKNCDYVNSKDMFEDAVSSVYFYFYRIKEAKNVKFDSNDLSEKFNSLEEKRDYELNKALNDTWRIDSIKQTWKDYSIELFEYVFEKHHKDYMTDFWNFYDVKLLENMGIKHLDEFIK